MTPTRDGAGYAASAAIAGLVVLLPVPAALHVPAAIWLLGILPGALLVRSLPDRTGATPEEMVGGALVAALPAGMALATALMWRPLPAVWCVAALVGLLVTVALLLPRVVMARASSDGSGWLVCIAAGLMTAAPLALNPNVRVYGDALFHGQIVNEIVLHGLPPQDPSFAGQLLAYAWPMHAWVAAIVHLSGVTPYELAPWLAFGGGLTLALVFLVIARASGASGATAHLSVAVMLFAMNALGALQAAVRYGVSPYVGHDRGGPGLAGWFAQCFDRPDVGIVAGSLVFHGHYALSSFLYKFVCVNTVSAALVLAAAAYASAVTTLRRGGARPAVFTALCTTAATLAHPVIGLSAAAALAIGLACALVSPVQRLRGLVTLLSVAWGGVVAMPLILLMLAAPIVHAGGSSFRISGNNLFALVQVLAVSLPLSLLAFRRAWRDDPRIASLAAGQTAGAVLISALTVFPSDAYAYPVYLAYLGSAWLVPHAVAAVREQVARRPALRAAATAALVLLPLSTMLLVQAFARHDARWGLAGYPETAAERAVFDRLRTVSSEAHVIDTQNFQMSAAAGYSARRSVFGGMRQVELIGYPHAEMRAREHAIRDLLYSPTTEDSTWRLLDRLGDPLYVVARRTPSGGRVFDEFERPGGDPIAKLDSLRGRLEPLVHTPQIALYRYHPSGGR